MRLAMAQMRMSDNVEENLEKSLRFMRSAKENGAELIFFPEIQLSPFFPQYEGRDAERYALTLDDPAVSVLRDACRELGIFASPNIYLSENGKRYDASLLIDDHGELLGVSRMVHIAQAEQFYEQDYYSPSEDGFHVYDTPFGKIGIVICFDRHYPESVRTEALMGAELILIPTANTCREPMELFEWEIRVQAFQNSVAIAMCNRVGREDGMEFSGASLLADADGKRVVLADDRERLVLADVDLAQSAGTRNDRPYTGLRRPEFYR